MKKLKQYHETKRRQFNETKRVKCNVKARNYFRQLWYLDREIDANLYLSKWLETKIINLSTQKAIENNTAKLAEIRAKLHENVLDLAKQLDETLALINTLEDSETRTVLIMHYVNKMSIQEISEITGNSRSKSERQYNKALAEFEKLLD